MWRISVEDSCIGSGSCTAIAPEHFVLVEGKARPVTPDVEPDELVLDAVASCPMEAITALDLLTGQPLEI